jgi:hypothetical protein
LAFGFELVGRHTHVFLNDLTGTEETPVSCGDPACLSILTNSPLSSPQQSPHLTISSPTYQ